MTVTVTDNDTAQVMGVMVAPGKEKLRVTWTEVDVGNATGYTVVLDVQWKSGVEDFNTTDRQHATADVTTASHTILGLANDTEYDGAGDRDPCRRQRRPAVG